MPPASKPPTPDGVSHFSAPKGVERACPRESDETLSVNQVDFSAPKGVERACPRLGGWFAKLTIARFQCPEGR